MQYLIPRKRSSPDTDTCEVWENVVDGAKESGQDFHRDNPDQERDLQVKV